MTEDNEELKTAVSKKPARRRAVRKPVKKSTAKPARRRVSVRKKKALELYLTGAEPTKEAAAVAAGYAPGNGARVLKMENLPQQIIEALGEKLGVSSEEVAANVAMQLRANILDKEKLNLPRLDPAQLDLFEKRWYDTDGNPKAGMPGVRPDLDRRAGGVRLLLEVAKSGADPEYGKKMFESGMEAAGQQYTALIEAVRQHLTPEGQRVLEERVAAMAGKN